jgi:hypothetical protein
VLHGSPTQKRGQRVESSGGISGVTNTNTDTNTNSDAAVAVTTSDAAARLYRYSSALQNRRGGLLVIARALLVDPVDGDGDGDGDGTGNGTGTGISTNIGPVLLDKRLQISDWTLRPLSEQQLAYAANDAYIPALLFQKLRQIEGDAAAAAAAASAILGRGEESTVMPAQQYCCYIDSDELCKTKR